MPRLSFFCLQTAWDEDYPEFPGTPEEVCRAWAVSMCGHDWHLEIDCEEDGASLSCTRCHAGPDDIYPDGREVLAGEFTVRPGYVLTLSCGSVLVNGEDADDYDRWAGPVTARLVVEEYQSLDMIGPEYDLWLVVEARNDVCADGPGSPGLPAVA